LGLLAEGLDVEFLETFIFIIIEPTDAHTAYTIE
jgi:hypothetical protein